MQFAMQFGFTAGEEVLVMECLKEPEGGDEVPEGTTGEVLKVNNEFLRVEFPKGTWGVEAKYLMKVQTKFGFTLGEEVLWSSADDDVPEGTTGTIIGFFKSEAQPRVRVKFPNATFKLEPQHLIQVDWAACLDHGRYDLEDADPGQGGRSGHDPEGTVDVTVAMFSGNARPFFGLSLSMQLREFLVNVKESFDLNTRTGITVRLCLSGRVFSFEDGHTSLRDLDIKHGNVLDLVLGECGSGWQYKGIKDVHCDIQGPFTLEQMRQWHAQGHFQGRWRRMPMRCNESHPFQRFEDLFPQGQPFETCCSQCLGGSIAS